MPYRLEVSKDVAKFIQKSTPKFRERIFDAFDTLCLNPYTDSLDVKPMSNKKGHYRLRLGKYRFLFTIIEEEILLYVYKADSRGDIYKK